MRKLGYTAEAEVYRKALVRLYCAATSGTRKTMDKAKVAKVSGLALDQGNRAFREVQR